MVIIIGAGIIGTSIAYYLSKYGATDVVVLEKEKFAGTGVTKYCQGGIRTQFTTEINIKFSLESLRELKGKSIKFNKIGYLLLDQDNTAEERVKMQNFLGVKSKYLEPTEIKRLYPFLEMYEINGGSFCPEDGYADPALLLDFYIKGAKDKGIQFEYETEVKEILKDGDKVVGVETNKGKFEGTVILAAGPQSKELGEKIGLNIPIIKKRKYMVLMDGMFQDFPIIMEFPTGWYIKKELKENMAGMSGKVETVDFEKKEEAVNEIIEATVKRITFLRSANIRRVDSSIADETPDKHAIIDNSVEGLIIATGFSGHGFMHSPAAGKAVKSLVKGAPPFIDISPLKLNREYNSTELII
ncbi:NAD(P)/FAD-dependent oxidoreductase [Candidatus Margulisiibacteriota bacterium]